MLTGTQTIVAGKFKDLLTGSIVATATAHNSLSPGNKWYEDSKFCLVFNCLHSLHCNGSNIFFIC